MYGGFAPEENKAGLFRDFYNGTETMEMTSWTAMEL